MSNYYAHIDTNNIVFAVTELSGEVNDPTLISINSYDTSLLGKTYDVTNKVFTQTLNQVKQMKLAELNQAYQSAVSVATFTSSATGTQKTYPINQEAHDNLKDLQQRLIADSSKDSFYFLSLTEGVLVNHTRTQFLQLLNDAESREVNLHNQNRTYANQINASTDITTLQAMTLTFS